MKVYTVKKVSFSFGNEETSILNNTVYGNFKDAVAAMKADCEVERSNPVTANQRITIDEKRGTAYISDFKTHADYTVEEHDFADGKLD